MSITMFDNMKIILADDHPLFRQALSITLKSHFNGAKFFNFKDSEEQINRLAYCRPDIDLDLENTTSVIASNPKFITLTASLELKINKKGEILAESPFLNNVLGEELNIYKIWEDGNSVYLADSAIGVYQFDIYATYSKTFYFKNTTSVCSKLGTLLFNQNLTRPGFISGHFFCS